MYYAVIFTSFIQENDTWYRCIKGEPFIENNYTFQKETVISDTVIIQIALKKMIFDELQRPFGR